MRGMPGAQMPRSGRFKRLELKQLIRNNFVAGSTAGGAELGRLLDLVRAAAAPAPAGARPAAPAHAPAAQAFAALRVLAEQLLLERCSSHATTQGCRVECTTALEGRDANVRRPAPGPHVAARWPPAR